MAEQFKEQGGVATMDPSHVKRWLTSRLMTKISSPGAVAARHRKAEQARLKAGTRTESTTFIRLRKVTALWHRSCSKD